MCFLERGWHGEDGRHPQEGCRQAPHHADLLSKGGFGQFGVYIVSWQSEPLDSGEFRTVQSDAGSAAGKP